VLYPSTKKGTWIIDRLDRWVLYLMRSQNANVFGFLPHLLSNKRFTHFQICAVARVYSWRLLLFSSGRYPSCTQASPVSTPIKVLRVYSVFKEQFYCFTVTLTQ